MQSTQQDQQARTFTEHDPNAGKDQFQELFDGLTDLLNQILQYEITNHGIGSPEFWINKLIDMGTQFASSAVLGLIMKGATSATGLVKDALKTTGKWKYEPKKNIFQNSENMYNLMKESDNRIQSLLYDSKQNPLNHPRNLESINKQLEVDRQNIKDYGAKYGDFMVKPLEGTIGEKSPFQLSEYKTRKLTDGDIDNDLDYYNQDLLKDIINPTDINYAQVMRELKDPNTRKNLIGAPYSRTFQKQIYEMLLQNPAKVEGKTFYETEMERRQQNLLPKKGSFFNENLQQFQNEILDKFSQNQLNQRLQSMKNLMNEAFPNALAQAQNFDTIIQQEYERNFGKDFKVNVKNPVSDQLEIVKQQIAEEEAKPKVKRDQVINQEGFPQVMERIDELYEQRDNLIQQLDSGKFDVNTQVNNLLQEQQQFLNDLTALNRNPIYTKKNYLDFYDKYPTQIQEIDDRLNALQDQGIEPNYNERVFDKFKRPNHDFSKEMLLSDERFEDTLHGKLGQKLRDITKNIPTNKGLIQQAIRNDIPQLTKLNKYISNNQQPPIEMLKRYGMTNKNYKELMKGLEQKMTENGVTIPWYDNQFPPELQMDNNIKVAQKVPKLEVPELAADQVIPQDANRIIQQIEQEVPIEDVIAQPIPRPQPVIEPVIEPVVEPVVEPQEVVEPVQQFQVPARHQGNIKQVMDGKQQNKIVQQLEDINKNFDNIAVRNQKIKQMKLDNPGVFNQANQISGKYIIGDRLQNLLNEILQKLQ